MIVHRHACRPFQHTVEHCRVRLAPRVDAQRVVFLHHRFEDAQHLLLAAVWWNLDHICIIEHKRADAVSSLQHAPRRQRRHFCRDHRLHRPATAEKHTLALIDDEQHGPVALFGVDADMRLAGTGGDAPVHIADVVAGQVTADLLEVQSASAQP
jgi:hypothetical protein